MCRAIGMNKTDEKTVWHEFYDSSKASNVYAGFSNHSVARGWYDGACVDAENELPRKLLFQEMKMKYEAQHEKVKADMIYLEIRCSVKDKLKEKLYKVSYSFDQDIYRITDSSGTILFESEKDVQVFMPDSRFADF